MSDSAIGADRSYATRWAQLERQSRVERDALIRMIAVELFFAHGYEAVGIRQIAAGLGINSATLYHYYQSKSAILETIMEQTHIMIIDASVRAVENASTPRLRFASVAGFLASVQVTSRKTCYVVDNEMRAIDRASTGAVRILDLRRRYERLWDVVIADGVRENDFACGDQTLARLSLLGMFTSTSLWYHPNDDRDREYVCLNLVDASLAMLSAQPLTPRERRELVSAIDVAPFDCEPPDGAGARGPLEFAELMLE